MANETCPNCKRKSLRYRVYTEDWICGRESCKKEFDKNFKEKPAEEKPPEGCFFDEFKNVYKQDIQVLEDSIIVTKTYFLEKGRDTLKGKYPKFKSEEYCAYPKHACCNSTIGKTRCEYMKYIISENSFGTGIWKCLFDKYKKGE